MDWRISKRTAVVSGGLALLLLGVALAFWVTGGFGGANDTTSSPSPAASSSPAPSGSPSATMPDEPAPSAPTVADLRKDLARAIRATSGRGKLSCEGTGELNAGMAVSCTWDPIVESIGGTTTAGQEPPSRPVYVAVLDDSGRYTFQVGDTAYITLPDSDDYPAGTINCQTLMNPPASGNYAYGLSYPQLLYYWMAAGSPASMDDDGNGLPCETAYPAEVVQRAASSPLVPGGDGNPTHAVAAVIDHAAAVLSGALTPGTVQLAGGFSPISDAVLASDAGTGLALPIDFVADIATQFGGFYIAVHSDSGAYGLSFGKCCGAGPNVVDYPDGATCSQLSQPPQGPDGDRYETGLEYPNVIFYWMQQGMPGSMDLDGNGRPCEAEYPGLQVDRYFNSILQP